MNAIMRNRTQYMPRRSEEGEQVLLFQWAKWNEGRYPELKWLFAIPNGGYRHIATAVRLKVSGVKKGVFDIMLPVARGGYHGLFIEMKVDKNKLTESQAEFQQFLIKQNYKASVCYSMEEAKDAIMRYLIGVRITTAKFLEWRPIYGAKIKKTEREGI